MSVALLIIDPQIDFHEKFDDGTHSHPHGSLAVPGANEDSMRIAQLILSKSITRIYVTLDSHHRNHIAHGIFWKNDMDASPAPFTVITHDDVVNGLWLPRNHHNLPNCLNYTKLLESKGRFKLTIWPEHCLIGSIGHAVVPMLNDALQLWAGDSGETIRYVHKGMNCLTEMYSAIEAEVDIGDDPSIKRNEALVKELMSFDKLLVCGQALSHCVAFTIRDIIKDYPREKLSNVILLRDGTSPVAGFEREADAFIDEMIAKGVQVKTISEVI